jgi:hypothetical protein
MALSPRLLRPRRFGVVGDSDVVNYIAAVEAADGQALEQGVRDAFAAFITGCKQDGIWSAIKASCILAGARTLSGALVPLVGAAPTNNNFVSGDYNRETGLAGSSTKSLNSNRAENSDGLNDNHYSVYASTVGTQGMIGIGQNTTISSAATRNRNITTSLFTASAGLVGISRSSSGEYTRRNGQASTTVSQASGFDSSGSILVFDTNGGFQGNHRLAFYSIGSSIDLALLDSRVSALYTAIGAAI